MYLEEAANGIKRQDSGALYGMALGDAMGMPAELWGRERARKFFGGKITGFIDGPKENDVAFNYDKAAVYRLIQARLWYFWIH